MQPAVSSKPYLIRAIHEWCSDQGLTPFIVVAVHKQMKIPLEYAKNNEIVLNLSYEATRNLVINNDTISFSARFGDISRDVTLPISTVVSIFCKETGEGMRFEHTTDEDEQENTPSTEGIFNPKTPVSSPASHPHLKIVK